MSRRSGRCQGHRHDSPMFHSDLVGRAPAFISHSSTRHSSSGASDKPEACKNPRNATCPRVPLRNRGRSNRGVLAARVQVA